MKGYSNLGLRKVKTSCIGNHPHCPNCIKEIHDGTYRECLDNPHMELDWHWYRNGAGCPNFIKRQTNDE